MNNATEPAFPVDGGVMSSRSSEIPDPTFYHGMTLRDWFAGQVMERMISLSMDQDNAWNAETVAHGCYLLADAMLKARNTAPGGR